MNKLLSATLIILALSPIASADPHVRHHSQDYILEHDVTLSTGQTIRAGTQWYKAPDFRRLKNELGRNQFQGSQKWAQQVLFGREIIYDTYYTIGEGRRDGLPPLAKGRIMNCTNCHAQEGTMPYAWPFFRTLTHFGQKENGDKGKYFANLGYYRDTKIRTRDCARHCGGFIEIPQDSFEMDALLAWIKVVRDGIYEGEGLLIPEFKSQADVDRIPGARIPLFNNILTMKADPLRGQQLYQQQCESCHSSDGKGLWREGEGFAIPPVSGPGAFSEAGGPMMIPVGAAFLKYNMPLARGRTMPEQDALDVMAYISKMPRDTVWWENYYFRHNPCSRPAFLPKNIGSLPEGFPFSLEQSRFGPWLEVSNWLKSDTCLNKNPINTPILSVDFNPRHSK